MVQIPAGKLGIPGVARASHEASYGSPQGTRQELVLARVAEMPGAPPLGHLPFSKRPAEMPIAPPRPPPRHRILWCRGELQGFP